MDLDSFLVSLYILVDDWWQEHHPSSVRKRKPGRPALPSRASSGRDTGWSAKGLWWLPPRRTTPAGHGRRPIGDGLASLGKRQIIEGVICQLKDFFSLERHRAKTLAGLLARLAAKVAAYTCGQRINDSLGRPLRHLAGLLV